MNAKNAIIVWACALSIALVVACGSDSDPVSAGGDNTSGNGSIDIGGGAAVLVDQTVADAMAANDAGHEAADDYSWSSSQAVPVTLSGATASSSSAAVTVDGGQVTITAPGTYTISGNLDDGQLMVDSDADGTVRLIFNGVDIKNSSSAPVFVKSADKTVIILADNTTNKLTDGSSYVFPDPEDDEPNAALFSKDDLSISGGGALIVDGNYNDGIASKDGLIIAGGTITVDAADDGIRGKDYLIVENGTLNVTSGGDGLKSDEDQEKGFILVKAGTVNVTAGGDAITAETDVLISDGTFNLTSGGGSGR